MRKNNPPSKLEIRDSNPCELVTIFIRTLFNNGGDLHKLTASLIFNKPLEQVTKKERYIAKSINFGLSYGMGAGGLQANLRENGIEIDKERAGSISERFSGATPG
jgi:DNA polymerase-1